MRWDLFTMSQRMSSFTTAFTPEPEGRATLRSGFALPAIEETSSQN
jgi:hypothetical protein